MGLFKSTVRPHMHSDLYRLWQHVLETITRCALHGRVNVMITLDLACCQSQGHFWCLMACMVQQSQLQLPVRKAVHWTGQRHCIDGRTMLLQAGGQEGSRIFSYTDQDAACQDFEAGQASTTTATGHMSPLYQKILRERSWQQKVDLTRAICQFDSFTCCRKGPDFNAWPRLMPISLTYEHAFIIASTESMQTATAMAGGALASTDELSAMNTQHACWLTNTPLASLSHFQCG